MEKKLIYIENLALWHPSREVRETLKKESLYVYDTRTWDEGNGRTLEPFVFVNYEGSMVANFEITNWDIDDERGKCINDMDAWAQANNVTIVPYDEELEERVKIILKRGGVK